MPNVLASRDRAGPHREETAIAPHAARPLSRPARADSAPSALRARVRRVAASRSGSGKPVFPSPDRLWFASAASEPGSRCLIFCLPYSGAGVGAFDRWQRSLPPGLELAAVRLPGRERRLAERPDLRPAVIAAAIAARADRPYAIFGHSVGATVGFEVIRALRQLSGVALPLKLYAAAAMPPGVPDPVAGAGELGQDECAAALTRLIGSGARLPDDPELRELTFPALRGDLRWLHRYTCRPEPPLPVPIVALAGTQDSLYAPAQLAGWAAHTCASFQLRTVPGDHFFPQASSAEVTRLIAADLLAELAAVGPQDVR